MVNTSWFGYLVPSNIYISDFPWIIHWYGNVNSCSFYLLELLIGTVEIMRLPLRWRHNELHSVSNHQPRECLLSRLFGRRSKKTSKLQVTGLCAGNSPGTGEFPAQRASNAENVSIWWRHHAMEPAQSGPEEYGYTNDTYQVKIISPMQRSKPPKIVHIFHVKCRDLFEHMELWQHNISLWNGL